MDHGSREKNWRISESVNACLHRGFRRGQSKGVSARPHLLLARVSFIFVFDTYNLYSCLSSNRRACFIRDLLEGKTGPKGAWVSLSIICPPSILQYLCVCNSSISSHNIVIIYCPTLSLHSKYFQHSWSVESEGETTEGNGTLSTVWFV